MKGFLNLGTPYLTWFASFRWSWTFWKFRVQSQFTQIGQLYWKFGLQRWILLLLPCEKFFFEKIIYYSKFYEKVGVISLFFPSHLNELCSILRFWLEKLYCGLKKTPQNNFSIQNFSVENNYFAKWLPMSYKKWVSLLKKLL